jgi:hypothetical protein
MRNVYALRRTRQVCIMLHRSLTRKYIRPRAAIGEGAELGIDRNKRIDLGFDFLFQFLIGDLADNAMAKVAPGKCEKTSPQFPTKPEQSMAACYLTPSLSPIPTKTILLGEGVTHVRAFYPTLHLV